MFHFLKGKVVGKEDSKIILQVGGLGFELLVSSIDFFILDQEYEVPVFLQWHAEHGMSLYGFTSVLEKSLFLLLISCSGIGPKTALQMLNQLNPEQFLAVLAAGDYKSLSSLQGIGPKKADMMILNLKEKAQKLYDSSMVSPAAAPHHLTTLKKLQETLTALNYSRHEIKQTLELLQQDTAFATTSFDLLMRKSLQLLAKRV